MRSKRRVQVLVDNDSWILPWANQLIVDSEELGYEAALIRDQKQITKGYALFLLGCTQLIDSSRLPFHQFNLVIHESDLPRGKGFAPIAWQILSDKREITVCLLEAQSSVDSGPVYFRETIHLRGHELSPEWRALQGQKSLDLCVQFLSSSAPAKPLEQTGQDSYFNRRTPADSELDINRSIADQFELLRVVDNDRYPAFFRHRGHTYRVKIEKL